MLTAPRPLAVQLIKFLAVLVIFFAGAVACIEVISRLLMPDKIAIWREPPFGGRDIQFVSEAAFHNLHGLRTFSPNKTIRIASYYPEKNGRVTKEYDCSYQTDVNGFVSSHPGYAGQEVLVLGDSFLFGLGGCDWVSRISPSLQSKVYAAAHPGYGPPDWIRIVKYLSLTKRPSKILLVFITDDFFRYGVGYDQKEMDCLSRRADCAGWWWHPISENLDELAKSRNAERYSAMDYKAHVQYHLPASYTLLKILLKGGVTRNETKLGENIHAIKELNNGHQLRLLWVNERREAAAPDVDTKLVQDALRGLNVSQCKLSDSDFMRRDNHPNQQGYEKIRLCLERLVEHW